MRVGVLILSDLGWEFAANGLNAASILLAGRNSIHTWWIGILGCLAFGYVFYGARLYADVTLQGFFIASSALGWWRWAGGGSKAAVPPVRHTRPAMVVSFAFAGLVIAASYGWLLHTLTDAYAPFLDSIVLVFSVLGQLLLVDRRVESWWCWLLVNTIAVPLFASRDLYITATLYAGFWINAAVSLIYWRRLAARTR